MVFFNCCLFIIRMTFKTKLCWSAKPSVYYLPKTLNTYGWYSAPYSSSPWGGAGSRHGGFGGNFSLVSEMITRRSENQNDVSVQESLVGMWDGICQSIHNVHNEGEDTMVRRMGMQLNDHDPDRMNLALFRGYADSLSYYSASIRNDIALDTEEYQRRTDNVLRGLTNFLQQINSARNVALNAGNVVASDQLVESASNISHYISILRDQESSMFLRYSQAVELRNSIHNMETIIASIFKLT